MTDKKFSVEEIIKGLECCKNCCCKQCDEEPDFQEAINLIYHQKSEIKRLQKEVNLVSIQFQDLQERTDEVKLESYKEFAEELKNILRNIPKWNVKKLNFNNVGFSYDDVFFSIDNLLKEMVGEKE